MFIFRGSELEFLFVLVSAASREVEVLFVPLVLESFEYPPVICDELQVGPSSVITNSRHRRLLQLAAAASRCRRPPLPAAATSCRANAGR